MPAPLAAWAFASRSQAQTRLRIPKPDLVETRSLAGYYLGALKLALQKTAEGGAMPTLEEVGQPGMNRERFRLLLAQGDLDLMWSSSTPERERLFEPVRFNLLKGVNEFRLLLVRRADLARFAPVQSLADLRRFAAGAGQHWSDAAILRANGFRVVTAARHDSLFRMLAAGRFDFLVRALSEVGDELALHDELDLVPEPHLMLRYPQPIYFFVHRAQRPLAERLLLGLQRADADGSLDRLFASVPALQAAWKASQTPSRKVLQLAAL